jgi:DNA-binding CsgD family transcriptional regulator
MIYTQVLCIVILGQDTREMASMLGVSIENIGNLRFRVRKKMNIDDTVDVD